MSNMTPDQMMDLVELLDDQVDDVTEALAPLLKISLQDIAAKLPVVDKARLYVLATYAIDSLLFSYLRLNGINAREHPVMRELERVKQYVKKINEAQSGSAESKRETTLNREVAARFVKHDLAGNDKWDRERGAEKAREKAAAHAKFEELSRKIERREAETALSGGDVGEEESSSCESDEENLKDKYEHEEILTINDTEDTPKDTKIRNEEQVNRILNTFKNHGVTTSPTGKRKFDEENANKRKKRQERKEAEKTNGLSNNGEEEAVPRKGKKKHFRR